MHTPAEKHWKPLSGKCKQKYNSKEHLVWASLDEDIKMYPEFFKTELKDPTDTVSGSSRARVLEPQAGHKIQCSLFEFMVHFALY